MWMKIRTTAQWKHEYGSDSPTDPRTQNSPVAITSGREPHTTHTRQQTTASPRMIFNVQHTISTDTRRGDQRDGRTHTTLVIPCSTNNGGLEVPNGGCAPTRPVRLSVWRSFQRRRMSIAQSSVDSAYIASVAASMIDLGHDRWRPRWLSMFATAFHSAHTYKTP